MRRNQKLISVAVLALAMSLGPEAAASATPAIEKIVIQASGLEFSALAAGPTEGEQVLLLHGFPQTSHAFRPLLVALAAAGYRAVAPDQRGYCDGARPEGVDAYRVGKLIGDVAAIADAMGASRFHLVGHDWGGAVAWGVAGRYPERLLSLTVLSTPHPRALSLAARTSDQAQRSSYMARFAAEDAEEQFLSNDAAFLRSILSPPITAEDREAYVAALGTPVALRGALNWYRALLQPAAPPPSGSSPAPPPRTLSVPTLYIWGAEDPVFSPEAARATRDFVDGPYEVHELAGVGHWVLESKPKEVCALLLAHMRRNAAQRAAVTTLKLDAELPSRGRLGGVSVDAKGNIYVSNFSASVWRVDPTGHVERLPVDLQGSSGNAVDRDGNLYQASFVDGRIVRITPRGNSEEYVTEGLQGPVGVAVAADGTLFVCNCRGNYIARVTRNRKAERWATSSDFDCPNGIALDEDGWPIVVSFNNGHVLKLEADGTARRLASLPGKNAHVAVTADAIYVTQIADNRVYRIARDGQASVLAGSGQVGLADGPALAATLARPNGIALLPGGVALVVNNLDGPWQGDQPTRIVLRRITLI